ncbi:MAG: putative lipoprotein, partial [Deltaproteobacteria bacterium]|nr:putative lipoprotein [Deltaproteobacteria bacterium]
MIDNSFRGSRSCLYMRYSQATVIDNTFVDCGTGFDIWGDASAVVRQNVFSVVDEALRPQYPKAISVGEKSQVIIDKNRIAGASTGIQFGYTSPTGSVTANVITDGGTGISVGWQTADLTVEGNTLMRNQTGLSYNREGGELRDNCVANNLNYGLEAASYHVDARNNWWGAVNGPKHWDKNPNGSGDQVYGENVEIEPWLGADNCAEPLPWLGADNCAEPLAPPVCGNARVDPGEECDDGGANSDTRPNACRTTCTLPTCGDNVIDDAEPYLEDCDDGNTEGGDGCPANCKLEITLNPHLIMGLGVCGSAEREIQVRNSLDQDIAGQSDVTYEWIHNGLAE